jgi:hypothetical protein
MPWQAGVSGNPNGRPPEVIEVREVRRLAQERTKEAYEKVVDLMRDADKDSVRLAAALAILRIAGMKMDGDVTLYVQQAAPKVGTPNQIAEVLQPPALPLN